MSIFNKNSENYLSNIVFFNRNKAFGAYVLRKNYTRNISIALIVANLTFILGSILIYLLLQNRPEAIDQYKMIDYRTEDFSLVEVEIPRIVQNEASQKKESHNDDAPPVVEEEEPEKLKTENNDDKKNTDGKTDLDTKSEENGKSESIETLKTVSSDTSGAHLYSKEIFMKVETPAEFPGGPIAFSKFLGENIQYPEYARKNKVDGIVYIHMIVNTDGSIEELKISRSIEESCDAEVLRVMKLSPKWIPARQKLLFVRQRIIVPIRFKSP